MDSDRNITESRIVRCDEDGTLKSLRYNASFDCTGTTVENRLNSGECASTSGEQIFLRSNFECGSCTLYM